MRELVVLISTAVLALIIMATAVGCGATPRGKEITIGNKNFAEQRIVGQLMKQLLEDRGFTVELKSGHTSDYLREAMEFGDIDMYAEYTGTAWIEHLSQNYNPGMDNNEVYGLVKEEDKENGLIWLNPIWNNNTYALASWPEFVEKHGLKTLSDLASLYRERQGKIWTSVSLEFYKRADGLPGLERHYDFKVDELYIMKEPVAVPMEFLKNSESEVAMVFGTDAEVAENEWHVYLDDKAFFPPYDLTPSVRQEVLDKYPGIAGILNELVATFPSGGKATPEIVAESQKVWQELNRKVVIDGMKVDKVAHNYLVEHGLIKG